MRNTDLNSTFFPVERRPVTVPGAGEVRGLQALVDVERDHVLSVVSEHYRVVTNREAADYGRDCFASVFGGEAASAMAVYHVNLTTTRSACTMDFTHEGSEFSPFDNDPWLPFLRVTNSYNGLMSLRFRVGFCRSICTNGMIFDDRSIQFRFEHRRRDIPRISFVSGAGDMGGLRERFAADLQHLRGRRVRKDQMLPLACRVLRVCPGEQDRKNAARWRRLVAWRARIDGLTDSYFREQGVNAYAALSVLTDFASRPSHVHTGVAMTDRLQRHSAAWMSGFLADSRRLGFSVERYVKDYRGYADLLSRN